MKKLFSLLALALLTLTVGAKTVTIDFSTLYSENQVLTDETITVDGVTLTFTKGSGTAPQYYANGTAARIYKGNTMTVTSADYAISNIDFTFDSSASTWLQNPSSASVGTVNNQGDWIGEAYTIVFTNNLEGSGAAAQVRIKKMELTLVGGETPPEPETKVAAPTFNPNGGTFNTGQSIAVSVDCATENASIAVYKVTDDPDYPEYVDYYFPPTGGGYATGTFYVTETGTYFAAAYKGDMEDSDTTYATFTFVTPTCAKPKFNPTTGATFTEDLDVTISTTTEGAVIAYTINDGDMVISEGNSVTVNLTETSTITAFASLDGYLDSESATATYTKVEAATTGPIFTLVTDVNDLAEGDHIIIVNSKEDGAAVAMTGMRTNNNFGGVNVVVADGKVQTPDANIITLEANGDYWNLKTADGYIFAPGGGNYMRLENEVDNAGNANAAITIGADTTIVQFQGQGTQKFMRYNANNGGDPIFSCYAEGSSVKGLVFIYKTVEEILEVAAPTFEPAANTTFIGSQEITLSCATPGAVIYYGFDNANWTEYTGPFTIEESCTVYAYAVVGDAHSTVAQAKYYKALTVNNIAEALALAPNTDFAYMGEAVVTYQNGINTWIKDATGYGLIYGEVPEMTTGTVIADGWTAYLKMYYGVPEFASPKNVVASEDVVTVDPVEMATVDTTDVNKYIIMKNMTLTADEAASTWLNADNLKFFDKFGVNPTIEDGKTYDVVGVVTIFHNAPEVYIISVTEVQDNYLRGDVDDNQVVNIGDVTALIRYLLSKDAEGVNLKNADCDLNESITIGDVTTLIRFLLSKTWPDE